MWARFKQWLRELLTPQAREEGGWWRRVFGDVQLERAVLRAIVWGSLALMVALAVAVVLNELRVAGWLRPRARRRRAQVTADAARLPLTLGDIENASPAAQPALLLEFIANRLAEQDRLPPARAFTVREVARRARLRDDAERARLAELAGVCERVRFSAGELAPQIVAAGMARGRELLAALQSPPATTTGAT